MRYAVYFTPPAVHGLTETASRWLGSSVFQTGGSTEVLPPRQLQRDEWQQLVAEPARYGFHATLKAPFALASGKTQATLEVFFEEFCARQAPTLLPRLELTEIGPFFALTCSGGSDGIDRLCEAVVESFEPWRAPPSADDMARRRPERLGERQRELLARWGYPYVFEEFQFHMTLTGPVGVGDRPRVREILQDIFAEYLGQPLPVEHLGLFSEPERGQPFNVLRHAPLRDAGERP